MNFGHGHQGFPLGPVTGRLLVVRQFEIPPPLTIPISAPDP
jgi:glycine/D-amino acid oxidase-like deaminating enzyme